MEASFTKIFEIFASKIEDGELSMDYFDCLKALTNFNYSVKKTQELFDLSESMRKNSSILLFDLDGNNKISIYEVRPTYFNYKQFLFLSIVKKLPNYYLEKKFNKDFVSKDELRSFIFESMKFFNIELKEIK